MTKTPRRKTLGYNHTVELSTGSSGWFYVGGPQLELDVLVERREDAETIAAALNLADNWHSIKNNAERLQGELDYFKEFK